jgi:maltose 6'-phosphate phosphatase
MRAPLNLFKYSVLLAAFLFLLPFNVSAWWWNSSQQCDDVADRGYINVLTFNTLFFSEVASVETRLEPFVEWLIGQEEPVDVIFLQEVIGGALALSEFTNSAKILKDMLSDRGLEYNLRTAFEVGLPGLFYTGNAILSRCEIKFSFVKRLPRKSEIEILGRVIKLPRNVQMTRLKIPGFGKFNAYNTHLCAGCNADERGEQLFELLNFINMMEIFIPGESPILLAGDFNIDRFKNGGEEEFLYQWIINEEFVDAYDEGTTDTLNNLCEDEADADIHCTVGVTAFDLPPFDSGKAGRIDFIFKMGSRFGEAFDSTVFFNPGAGGEPEYLVSDHAAVLVRIPLLSSE